MKIKIFFASMLFAAGIFGGCSIPTVTRTEEDIYTITERDTTVKQQVRNAPGDRDNGVIYPSSRTTETGHDMVQRDSIVTREYPNLIRIGLFESIGMIGTASGNESLRPGMFGLFYDLEELVNIAYLFDTTGKAPETSSALFSGAIYRFGIAEWRLRWFRDAQDWSVGTSGFEILVPSNKREEALAAFAPIYLRKRYYLRDKIPYIAITPSVGIGVYPSQYVNLSGSIDVGSIGGLNLRGYLGYALGQNTANSPFTVNTSSEANGKVSSFLYAGIGVSVLDFLNRAEELEREWKYHEHSSWNIGLFQGALIYTGADTSAFQEKRPEGSAQPLISGFIARLANASVAIPYFNNRFYVGTSLLNTVFLGRGQLGIGILPIRAGYWHTLIEDDLTTEPFVEYNYYPSNFVHIGNRVNLRISDQLNFNLILGYAAGSTGAEDILGSDFADEFGIPTDFSSAYIGIGIGISDRIFFPKEIRYNNGGTW